MKRNESSPLREILAAKDTIEQLNNLTEPEKHGLDPMLNQLHMRSLASTKETWDHSFQVLEQGISIAQEMGITPTLVLKTALLFHDIGKPLTYKNTGGRVTFHNHEHVGARIAWQILPGHGYTKREVKEICALIRFHMRDHNYSSGHTTDKAVRKLIRDVTTQAGTSNKLVDGVPTFTKLMVLFRADVTTTNKKLKHRILGTLDTLQEQADRIMREDTLQARRPAIDGHQVITKYGLTPGGDMVGRVMDYLRTEEGLQLGEAQAWAAAEHIITHGTAPIFPAAE